MDTFQSEVEAKGREIFARMEGDTPRVFSQRNITGRLLDWSMRNEALKVQLFRFVDVLPSLKTSADIARHAQEYLGNGTVGLPAAVRLAIRLSPKIPWLAAVAARQSVLQMAKTFILARDGPKAIPALRQMRQRRIAFTVDILGETAVSEAETQKYYDRYLALLESLADEVERWPRVPQIDCDDRGEIPVVNVSIKISALDSQIHPTDPERALARLAERLRPLLLRAKERGVLINFDMESTPLKDLTLTLFKRLLGNPDLQNYQWGGIALQAYLRDSERDLEELIQWAREQNRRITIRLIKGAYWDYERVIAQQRGWPVPVFEQKAETDANYERLARRMLENARYISSAFGTHSVRSIASCLAHADRLGLPRSSYEFQMLYGMAEPIKRALIKMGYRVRDYCPLGEVLPGMSYLVRRLLENTSNQGFLRATFSEHAAPEELLQDPAERMDGRTPASEVEEGRTERGARLNQGDSTRSRTSRPPTGHTAITFFQNEPHTDFTLAPNRDQMAAAIAKLRPQLGQRYPLVIAGRNVWTKDEMISRNPARPSEVVGRVARSDLPEAETAVLAARKAFPEWCKTDVESRARLLEHAAQIMRKERFQLAALEIFETGKNWVESDADVAEAIDFCNFYAGEIRRISTYRYVVPGETSVHHYIPRGVGVVIAPWNFPLAILCGMASAALVAGNCVILKPAEQSSVIAAKFMEILQRAGFPPGVVHFIPGVGENVGKFLVEHAGIDFVAFTGSREVGLKICETAGRTQAGQRNLKKVICEMGGKNAVIVDSDADLDEAIPGILQSAFGYQGQKCSALSRLIVLEENHDRVVRRLIEACRNLEVGLPEDPGTVIGPVIDEEARQRVHRYIELGKEEAEMAFQGAVPDGDGFFVPPTIFTNVPPKARIAQEEIFGPVLCILKARHLEEALAWANDSLYALTGGFYSRSPANIERVKAKMQVGNLYINRSITGALVARHPFGGFKMSGSGTKAGGYDYLQHFLFPRVVTENTMRRGFAPESVHPPEVRGTAGE